MNLTPPQTFVERQNDEVTNKIKIIDTRYANWLASDEKRRKISNPREVFNEQCEVDLKEVKKWKSELKFLNYILS